MKTFSLLALLLSCAISAEAVVWTPDTVLGAGFEVHSVDQGTDYSGPVRSTVVRHRSDCGDSTAILYIHGYNDYFFQDEEAERLADSCYHFYAVDLRKYGRSLTNGQEPYELRDISEYYADIDSAVAAMRGDGIRRAILMGHSTGGLVASSYMSHQPDTMFRALVLNSPFLDWNMNAFMQKVATPAVGLLGKLFPHMKISQGSKDSPYGESLLRGRHGEWDFNTQWKTIRPRKVEASWVGAITRAQKNVRKGRINVPVLLMHSDKSAYGDEWSPEFQHADGVLNVNDMKKQGPKLGDDVDLHTIPGGMHDLFLSAHDARENAYSTLFDWLYGRGFKAKK
ncbi:MAG: alpha/beta hydrolase [Muribaculaceae bacterium]|nr:alpha/beta hydrolase [Muribaculaceae bacterium]